MFESSTNPFHKVNNMAKNKETAAPATNKTTCPITREQFAKAATVHIQIDGGHGNQSYVAMPKEFSTGSLGWNLNEKSVVTIDGVACKVQIGLNVTVIGSKDAK